ncbi:MAG: dienelactone hydrolase [Flavobacteriales bacterium]|jgi:dienelactone hydrolase
MIKILSAVLALSISSITLAAPITFNGKGDFDVKADYYAPEQTTSRAVLMLHQCNHNRSMYNEVGPKLSEHGIHALSIDFRGFGESINQNTNVETIRALPQEQRRQRWDEMTVHWEADVQQAYNYLAKKVGKDGSIGVIGASCGGRQARQLAETHDVTALSFFSLPFMNKDNAEEVNTFKEKVANKPTLFITAEKDNTFVVTRY